MCHEPWGRGCKRPQTHSHKTYVLISVGLDFQFRTKGEIDLAGQHPFIPLSLDGLGTLT